MLEFDPHGVDECRVCGRDNASGKVAWNESGVAVPACSLHHGCKEIEGEWYSTCDQCGGRCEPGESFCDDVCWDAWINKHRRLA